jgi:hypothetical protein
MIERYTKMVVTAGHSVTIAVLEMKNIEAKWGRGKGQMFTLK